ncbi:MAG: hypothetical protein ACF8Q5_10530 [Phycisphaerales bacterium JB040]
MRTAPSRPSLAALLLAPLLLGACTNTTEVTVRNATSGSLTAVLRVDRLGDASTMLSSHTLRPGQEATLISDEVPPLEYIELAITRPGDIGNVPTTRRVPRGVSAWTLAPDPDAWSGVAIIEGIDDSMSRQPAGATIDDSQNR